VTESGGNTVERWNWDKSLNSQNSVSSKRVLVLEDNFLIALDAEDMLKSIGIGHVEIAINLEQATALITQHRFDFALLDVDLGRETSFDFAGNLVTLGIPFGFVSGYEENADFPASLRSYPRLPKPFNEDMLRDLLMAAQSST
jgi:two-component SAPR family response regulator